MNKERLEKLAAHIEALPSSEFDMRRWCGTPCCIGGHAEKLFDPPNHDVRTCLDLTWEQEDSLFWSHTADTSRRLPDVRQAAAVIRHLIKTGNVDWSRGV